MKHIFIQMRKVIYGDFQKSEKHSYFEKAESKRQIKLT